MPNPHPLLRNRARQPTFLLLIVALAIVGMSIGIGGCQSRPSLSADTKDVVGSTDAPDDNDTHAITPDDVTGLAAAVIDPAANGAAPCCIRNDLWDRIRAGFKFDLTLNNARIDAERDWYLANPQYLDRVIARGARYLHFIVEETEARDMPLELALLPVVESAFDPFAYSVADAAGPWQFIPSTGRIYGLKQTWWYDGRRDIRLSTRAALDYLEELAARFNGDYYKALASYNAGAGTVSRAISRNIRAGKKTDYWSLKVPRETSAYVPKLVALAQIIQDPEKYGVRINPIPDEPRFVLVDIGHQIDLARAAELADMPLTELYLYNPAWSRWMTDSQSPQQMLVPIELADAFRASLANTPKNEYLFSARHDVVGGETLESIALKYNLSTDALRMVNYLAGETVNIGETLLIPQPRLPFAARETTYAARIVALNKLRGRPARSSIYTVRAGDTLSAIARNKKVTVRDIARWNRMSISKPLRIGQKLVLQGVSGGGTTPAPAQAARAGNSDKRVTHQVRRGETLSGLARKFRVSVHDVARWNDFSPKRELRIGEKIKFYLD